MAAIYYSGLTGDLTIGAKSYNITSWKLTKEVTEIETTNVSDNGNFNMIPGKKKATATVEVYYDKNTHGGSPSPLKEGSSGTATLARNTSDAAPFTGTAYITKVDLDHSLDVAMKATLSLTFAGSYTDFDNG